MTDSSDNLSSSSSQPKGATGLKRIILATGYSINGLRAAWRNESAIRQEMVAALILIPLALFLSVTMVERILMIGSVLLVLIVELINSAIEAVVDRIGAERHELSGRAKDMGSAAVLVALSLAMFTWIGILI
ncbi:diacylglycerol kinase [Hahella aquimaris]|uniref:diacylglycerol kinase n=1 Tax=Hahella sp. HNIBRBA332 TaxID=3015983 RepID=UPI00273AD624|nr:diacylglycerol kinase [Hahella sp. HNIBRBA332]WLQ14983.1 diacylglycerol kinase [Hahella sp. HNIBRBA332]